MRLTTDKNDWTPIDPNLENELLNAYERIAKLESNLSIAKTAMHSLVKVLNTQAGSPVFQLQIYEGMFFRVELVRRPLSNRPLQMPGIQHGTSFPTVSEEGEYFYRTDLEKLYVYKGGVWSYGCAK